MRERIDTEGEKLTIKMALKELCPEGTICQGGTLTTVSSLIRLHGAEGGVGFARSFCTGLREMVEFGADWFF